MRAVCTLVILLLCFSRSAQAQLRDGSIAPNFTLKDVNGNVQDLYTYLDQGKTVFVEFFTTWCPPCQIYHMEGHLDSLYREHGPAGYPGVNANTTDDIMVLMVEVEYANTWEDLYGGAGGWGYNWVAGTPYPICDTPGAPILAVAQGYELEYIPTTFMICRDRLTKQLFAPSAVNAYLQSGGCPHYPPSAGIDAKATPYQDKPYFICNATPKVRFQNYSQTNHITNATIHIKNGANTVYTHQWSGNLAPYGVATVPIPSFSPAAFLPYAYEVEVAGDSYSANDRSLDSAFRVYGSGNALTLPDVRNYETTDARLSGSGQYAFKPYSQWWDTLGAITDIIGTDGQPTTALLALDGHAILGNYNTLSSAQLGIQFDYSELSDPAHPDTLIMEISTNCGASWQPVWSRSGSELTPPVPYASFQQHPMDAGNWKHFAIDVTGYQDANLLLRTRFKGEYSWGFLDNIKLTPWTTSVGSQTAVAELELYPNPAADVLYIRYGSEEGDIIVRNVMGQRVLAADLRDGSAALDVRRLSAGVYTVQLITAGERITRKFSRE